MAVILNNHRNNAINAINTATDMVHLPKTFLGYFPLYYGMEIGLGFTIINKFCGVYGILALFSGHALSAMQWIFYLLQFMTLIIFSKALYQLYQPHLVYYSFTLLAFTIDTLLSLFFTIFFTTEWYGAGNGVDKVVSKRATEEAIETAIADAVEIQKSQAASLGYEYFSTVFIILVGVIGRLYINFLLASFVKALFKTPKYIIDENDETNDINNNLKNKNVLFKYWYKVQKSSYNICKKFLQ